MSPAESMNGTESSTPPPDHFSHPPKYKGASPQGKSAFILSLDRIPSRLDTVMYPVIVITRVAVYLEESEFV